MKIGTQLIGLKKELEQDLPGTLRRLREIGFDTVEPMVLFQKEQAGRTKNLWTQETLTEALPILKELDMPISSCHIGVGIGWLSMPPKMIAENVLSIQERTGIHDYVISGNFDSAAKARHWAKIMRKTSDMVHPGGARILCHNHDGEHTKVRGKNGQCEALDVFFDNAGPDVMLELDIGWAAVAGDEIATAVHYADRVALLHLKDFYPGFREAGTNKKNVRPEQFAPIGEGAVRHAEVIAMHDRFPNFDGRVIIDQDKYTGDMLDALRIGFGNVKHWIGG